MAAKAEAAKAEVKTPEINEVEVFLPKVPGEAPEQFVAVNGKAWQIPRGKKYKVPDYVALVLEDMQKAQEAADEFSAEEQKKMKVIQGAPV